MSPSRHPLGPEIFAVTDMQIDEQTRVTARVITRRAVATVGATVLLMGMAVIAAVWLVQARARSDQLEVARAAQDAVLAHFASQLAYGHGVPEAEPWDAQDRLEEMVDGLLRGGEISEVSEGVAAMHIDPIADLVADGRLAEAFQEYLEATDGWEALAPEAREDPMAVRRLRRQAEELHEALAVSTSHLQVLMQRDIDRARSLMIALAAILTVGAGMAWQSNRGVLRRVAAEAQERQAAAAALADSEARLAGILGAISDVVLAYDETGEVLYVNDRITDMYGYAPQEILGQNIMMLAPAAERAAGKQQLQEMARAVRAGANVSGGTDGMGQHKDGRLVPIHWSGASTGNTHRGKLVFTCTVRDISAVREAQGRLEEMVTQLQSRVGSLLGVVSAAAEGNLAVGVPPMGNDAMGRLGDGLSVMVGSLRALVGEVQRSGSDVAHAATELASMTEHHEASASEQAAAVSEISATARRIFETSRALVDIVAELDNRVHDTAERATRGQESLDRMHTTMDRLSDASKAIGVRLGTLSEKAANITSVVQTITRVADQTNLLSLNAAIEAEKAGEYGRGFSVVATEIRRLADQTAVATLDISRIVKEIQGAVDAGVMGMEHLLEEVRHGVGEVGRASAELTQIISQVGELGPHFTMVCERMDSQSGAAAQISEAVEQLTRMTATTADALGESSVAIRRLATAASGMQQGVSRFRLQA